jgi:hypothetical protein
VAVSDGDEGEMMGTAVLMVWFFFLLMVVIELIEMLTKKK